MADRSQENTLTMALVRPDEHVPELIAQARERIPFWLEGIVGSAIGFYIAYVALSAGGLVNILSGLFFLLLSGGWLYLNVLALCMMFSD